MLDLRPDVVTLDVKMPRMGGLEALRRIMAECPTPVLLLSSLTSEGADVTLRGLELGAMDFVDKSSVQGHMNLLEPGRGAAGQGARAGQRAPRRACAPAPPRARAGARGPARASTRPRAEVVVIGTSTGGPPALQAIIPRLPAASPARSWSCSTCPSGFTRSLAERLDPRSVLPRARGARTASRCAPGCVLIAPAGRHMKVRRAGPETRVWLDDEPRGALHRPSVDVLMASVAKVYGARALGVVLTGWARTAWRACARSATAGGRTLAESEETCVIYGMPKAAVEAGSWTARCRWPAWPTRSWPRCRISLRIPL